MPVSSTKTIPEKLQLKPGRIVLFVNKPEGYDKQMGPMPNGVAVTDRSACSADIIQVFVKSQEQLEEEVPRLKKILTQKGMIWITYPKGSPENIANINRDTIAAYATTVGMEAVAIISIDDYWSALRLKVV